MATTPRRQASHAGGRGPLKSMRVSDGFRTYVLEQLALVKRLHARAMFGGIGLYADDVFFGIVAADTLYFKTDDSNRRQYEAAGMTAFKPYADRAMTMPYYQVPAHVLEDERELSEWAKLSVGVAKSAAKKAKPKAKRVRRP